MLDYILKRGSKYEKEFGEENINFPTIIVIVFTP